MVKDVKFSSSIKATSQTSDVNLETDLVATITPPGGESQVLIYDPTTPSGTIISGLTCQVGVHLEPHYIEEMTESVERSRGLLDGGFKFGFKLPDALGGIQINLERKPREEIKTIKKAIYMTKRSG